MGHQIKVIVHDSNHPAEPWFTSAWVPDGSTDEQHIKKLNAKAKTFRHMGIVTYELTTLEAYNEHYRKRKEGP